MREVWLRGRIALYVIALFLLLAVCGGCRKKQPPPPPPPRVTVAQPVRRMVSDYLELNGTSRAVRSVQLVARVPGYLEKVLFRDGQLVQEGQRLFIIQQSTNQAKLGQAEAVILQQKAQLDYAEKQLVRYSNMLKLNAASKAEVDNWQYQRDQALANLKNAQAQRDLALLDLRYTVVEAPFSGRIDRHLKDQGNLVGAGENTVLAQLSQVDPIYVYFSISDLDLARLMKTAHGIPGRKGGGWPMAAALPGETGYPHSGTLDFAASTVSDATGTLLMRGVIPNSSGYILPGLQTRVRVPLESKEAWLVPDTAVQSDQQGNFLLVVTANDVVERRPVTTGTAIDHLRVVEQGIQGTEWVVVKGQLRAAPGKRVTPLTEAGTTPPGFAPAVPPPGAGGGGAGGPAAPGNAPAAGGGAPAQADRPASAPGGRP